ncbi:hypothetical protein BTJ39_18605 [Izhakiella australiensis]|uniref:D-serine dehydratase-like domain-containing protein n=1 Tax=Izhakiella australiensis TaxID=1926881 RepID=A0A1S8YHP5_9GAMM|nr:alanine racemase [Izhakiella australiensis]OON38462.1 hypothetical protein BTJ39_18605 [Izhakiella australiensis]
MSTLFPLRVDGKLDPLQSLPHYKSVAGDGDSPLPPGTPVLQSDKVFSPVMVMKQQALNHNLRSLADWCREQGVLLAAHGKTSMAPAILRQAVQSGAWGLSAATPAQVRALRRFGIRNLFLANELVDPAGIRWIGDWQRQHPDQAFLCYVDSLQGVHILQENLQQSGAVLDVLLETSIVGGRTGCRTLEEALAIARAVKSSANLRLVGVAGYEGAVAAGRSERSLRIVSDYCRWIASLADSLAAQNLFATPEIILSAGGGAWFDVVVETFKSARPAIPATILIRSGAYMAHDDGLYARIAPFSQPGSAKHFISALEIWGRVLSRPEPGLALLDFGRRDAPFDQDMPIPHQVRQRDGSTPREASGYRIKDLNDQHAYLQLPADDPLQPGDWVGCGISHPCTAFDKWRYIPLVDEDYRTVDSIFTAF